MRKRRIKMFKPFFTSQADKNAETEQMLELLKDSGYAKHFDLSKTRLVLRNKKHPYRNSKISASSAKRNFQNLGLI